jgi:hypothetical protein
MWKVVRTGEGKLLAKLLDGFPMAIGYLGERELIGPNLPLLAIEQCALLRTLEEPPAGPHQNAIRPFQGAVAPERPMAVVGLHDAPVIGLVGVA